MGLVSFLVSSESRKGRVNFSLLHLYIHPSSVHKICWETMSFQHGPACLSTLYQRGDEIFILGDIETLDRALKNVIKVGSALSKGWTR